VGGISRLAFRVWRRFLFLRIPPRFAFREKRISHKEHKGSTLIIFCVLCDLCGLLGPGAPPVEFPVLEFNPLCDLISVSQLFISERSGPARQSGESL
jgi:hypothetical protein